MNLQLKLSIRELTSVISTELFIRVHIILSLWFFGTLNKFIIAFLVHMYCAKSLQISLWLCHHDWFNIWALFLTFLRIFLFYSTHQIIWFSFTLYFLFLWLWSSCRIFVLIFALLLFLLLLFLFTICFGLLFLFFISFILLYRFFRLWIPIYRTTLFLLFGFFSLLLNLLLLTIVFHFPGSTFNFLKLLLLNLIQHLQKGHYITFPYLCFGCVLKNFQLSLFFSFFSLNLLNFFVT